MYISRERAIMNAVGRLTEADLAHFGILTLVKTESSTVEIEDIDYVEGSLAQQTGDNFQCEGSVFFTCDDGRETVSDDKPFHVAGRFNGEEVLIESLQFIPLTDHSALAAIA